jgi:hypothetical protein
VVSADLTTEQRRQRLVDWAKAPSARKAHPREEHFIPLRKANDCKKRKGGKRAAKHGPFTLPPSWPFTHPYFSFLFSFFFFFFFFFFLLLYAVVCAGAANASAGEQIGDTWMFGHFAVHHYLWK